ncbi:MAG: DUF4038 domain-containing protein [Kiritimatiellaeota bacterium]|nr:DUF4038 domain-containing protein [Kiritimatiellota bacterium]
MRRLRVSENGRFLVRADGSPFFALADTAWEIAWRLDRGEVDRYIRRRQRQKFNTIAIVAFSGEKGGCANAYGDSPFLRTNGDRYDPLRPVTTPGDRPGHPEEYDYWDHLEYVIDAAGSAGMYVILLPAWGNCTAGGYGNGAPSDEIIFDVDKARRYGRWIGNRFRSKTNLLWMLGGDRSAVYGPRDYRPVFRAMAAGIAAGVGGPTGRNSRTDFSTTLMSYHPQKWAPNSSEWFHNDPWLAFNSIQDQPKDQVPAVEHDWGLRPPKPTWLFEGGYEHRQDRYNDWHIRYQSYQTVFAGGFGVTYGNMYLYNFPGAGDKRKKSGDAAAPAKWEASLDDPGAGQMQYLLKLMASLTDEQFLDRVPDPSLIDGDAGAMEIGEGVRSNRLQATRGRRGDYAMVYSANGRAIRVRMERLAGPAMAAFWFDPRSGKWWRQGRAFGDRTPFQEGVPSGPGPGAGVREFDPPGEPAGGNDWVLMLGLGK